MLFNSFGFLIFFPIVVGAYFLIPEKLKKSWLLAASYYFYMSWNAKYAILILFSTIVTYISGIAIEWYDSYKVRKKIVVGLCIFINLFILFFFKYCGFAANTIETLAGIFGVNVCMPTFDVVLPVGISFYTFQALGYTIDVYRGDIKAERDFVSYALFVSFFPQLVAGPIERSKNLLSQLHTPRKFNADNFRCQTAHCGRRKLRIDFGGFVLSDCAA